MRDASSRPVWSAWSALLCAVARRAGARSTAPASSSESLQGDAVCFLPAARWRSAAHESGHLVFDLLFDADPGIDKVDFHGIPFFAITHRSGLSPRREFMISSAGFWVQHAGSEWLLTRRPGPAARARAVREGRARVQRARLGRLRRRRVRADRSARTRHARHRRIGARSTSRGSARWSSRRRCSIRGATSSRRRSGRRGRPRREGRDGAARLLK